MDRSARSKQTPPTMGFFAPATNGSGATTNQAFTGYEIDANGEDAWIVFRVPHDYGELLFCEVETIALIADASMTVSVDVSYCNPNESSNQQTSGPIRFTLTNVGLNQRRTIDIRQLLIGGDVSPIKPNDIVGVHVERLAIMADDTDLLVLGVNFGYR